ncbi:MAG: glycosyltransferase family 39 protein, partial [Candidatus Nanoarchaeia archaeon]
MKFNLTNFSALAIIVSLWAILYLPFLGSRELQGNEARRILPAISMIETGNWITPELANQPYYKKPPLINWMIAVAFKISGNFSELSARLVSSLMILLFAIFAVLMPSGWLDKKARTATAIIFLSTYGVLIHGRLIEIEASLAVLTGIATLWWLNVFSLKDKNEWKLWISPGIVLGLGLLLKGPIILMFFYATVFLMLFRFKKMKSFFSIPHLISITIALGIFLIWVLKMKSLIPPGAEATVSHTWKAEILDEINPVKIEYGKWVQSIVMALSFFLPWGIFIPFLWGKNFLASDIDMKNELAIAKTAAFSLLLGFFLTNIMPGTEARYSVPLLPLASAISAFVLCKGNNSKMILLCRKAVIALAWILFPLTILCLIIASSGILNSVLFATEFLKNKMLFEFKPANFAVSFLLIALGIILFILLILNRKKISSGFELVLASAVVAVLAMLLVYFIYIPIENS